MTSLPPIRQLFACCVSPERLSNANNPASTDPTGRHSRPQSPKQWSIAGFAAKAKALLRKPPQKTAGTRALTVRLPNGNCYRLATPLPQSAGQWHFGEEGWSFGRRIGQQNPGTGTVGLLGRTQSGIRGTQKTALLDFLEVYRKLPFASELAAEAAIRQSTPLDDASAQAVAAATYGWPRCQVSPVAGCIAEERLVLRNNNGGGDCLFHALGGKASQPSLDTGEILALRDKTAAVREAMPDDERTRSWNGHEVALALNQALGDGTGDSRRPVSNALYAALQRIPGIYSGESEIAQWLKIPDNPVRMVTVVDALPGNEALLVFENSGRRFLSLSSLGTTEEAVSRRLADLLASAVTPERDGAAGEHIALYRTAVHYQRIVGFASNF